MSFLISCRVTQFFCSSRIYCVCVCMCVGGYREGKGSLKCTICNHYACYVLGTQGDWRLSSSYELALYNNDDLMQEIQRSAWAHSLEMEDWVVIWPRRHSPHKHIFQWQCQQEVSHNEWERVHSLTHINKCCLLSILLLTSQCILQQVMVSNGTFGAEPIDLERSTDTAQKQGKSTSITSLRRVL